MNARRVTWPEPDTNAIVQSLKTTWIERYDIKVHVVRVQYY